MEEYIIIVETLNNRLFVRLKPAFQACGNGNHELKQNYHNFITVTNRFYIYNAYDM